MFKELDKNSISKSDTFVKSFSINDIKKVFDEYDIHYTDLDAKYYELYELTGNEMWYRWAERAGECGSYLGFWLYEHAGLRLKEANFCGDRLCLMCNWRRSLKTYSKVARIMDYLTNQSEKKYRFLFLTLSIRNCRPNELEDTINTYFYAYNKFTKNKRIKRMLKGYFRALEITYNEQDRTFHPHLHVILAVNNSYFDDKNQYIRQAEFTDIWQSAAGIDYEPIVDIRAFKGNKGIAEASKYSVKMDKELLKKIPLGDFKSLKLSILYRRFVGLGGILRQTAALLKIKIDDDSDISFDDLDDIKDDTLLAILRFIHSSNKSQGYKGFILLKNDMERIGF